MDKRRTTKPGMKVRVLYLVQKPPAAPTHRNRSNQERARIPRVRIGPGNDGPEADQRAHAASSRPIQRAAMAKQRRLKNADYSL